MNAPLASDVGVTGGALVAAAVALGTADGGADAIGVVFRGEDGCPDEPVAIRGRSSAAMLGAESNGVVAAVITGGGGALATAPDDAEDGCDEDET